LFVIRACLQEFPPKPAILEEKAVELFWRQAKKIQQIACKKYAVVIV
jgi:hypothetical protein